MYSSIYKPIRERCQSILLLKNNNRSAIVKNNILTTFIIKGLNIIIGLLLVRLIMVYISHVQYGIWVTLTSIIGWFAIFDIGIGNGLRNKLAEAIANGKYKLAKIYISTAYAIIGVIMTFVGLIFCGAHSFIDWISILKAPIEQSSVIGLVVLITFLFFCFQLFLQIITTVLTAHQQYGRAAFISLLINSTTASSLFILTKLNTGNLMSLALCFSITPIIVLLITSVWFYNFTYKYCSPSFSHIRYSFVGKLFTLGIKFFFIQIGALILFQTSIIIINQLYGPTEVATFNIQYKLFSIIIVLFGIFLAPLWSAFTDAYSRKDLVWIQRVFKKTHRVWLLMMVLTSFVLVISPFIFNTWLGDKFKQDFIHSCAMCFYVLGYTWLMIPCFLLNGIGKIKLQFYLYLVCIFFNIPLSFIFTKYFGVAGVILSNTLIFCKNET